MSTKLVQVVILAAMLAVSAFGQTSGEITGVVADSSGSVIVGATITVTNPQTDFRRETTTNNGGNYSFPNLPPGVYSIKVGREGFQSGVRNAIELQVQQTARIDFQLSVGAVTETVEVAGGAPLLNTENATIGTVIENKRILDLPLNGRSFISLISLSPNVITGQTANTGNPSQRGGSDRSTVSLSISGLRREFIYYTIDGVSNTDVDYNTYAFLPSIDALQEFKVQTGVYSAEFGREAAQVNVSSKSGTNGYHGAVFEFLRNNALDARPYGFTNVVPVSAPFKWNQYGFTLGGPVRIPKLFNGKDRLFFMSNYEGFKLRSQAQRVFSVPSVAMRTGNFSELLPQTVIRDSTNNLPFPGNIIPPQRQDPIALRLLQYLPEPNVTGVGVVSNHLALQNSTTDKDQFTQRIDFLENEKSSWFGRYSWQSESLISPSLGQAGSNVSNLVRQVAISNVRLLSPTLVNELRLGYLGFSNLNLSLLAYKTDVGSQLKIPLPMVPPPVAWGIPNVILQGFTTFGDATNGPFAATDHTFQFIDGVSWTRGAHSLKAGIEIRRDRYNQSGNQNSRGAFRIQNQGTGYGFGDYMIGNLQTVGATAALAVAQLRATSQAYYITDSWRVRPNLTIEAGLRYEYTPPYGSKNANFMNVIIPHTGDPALILNKPAALAALQPYLARDCAAYGQSDFYPPGLNVRFDQAVQTKCVSGMGTTLVRSDRTNFAPRLGIAWSPSQKWTVRAGFGMFYSQDYSNPYLDMARNSAGRIFLTADSTLKLTFQQPLGANSGSSSACGVSNPSIVCVTLPFALSADPNRRTPYVVQYELNIQRQLTSSTVLEVGYLGSQGHHLQRQLTTNGAVPAATGSLASRTAYPLWSTGQLLAGGVNSNYESGSLKLTRRLSSGLSALVGYTFSKSLDSSSGISPGSLAQSSKPQNGWCNKCEYALSDFDSRQRFVASVLYELPFGKEKKFLTKGIASRTLGGWQINAIVSRSSGFPVIVTSGVNQSNSNTGADRPDATYGVPAKLSNPTTNQWFNTQSVHLQPFGTYGNVGRNSVIGPGVFSGDFSALKNFNFTEAVYLQFRFECFNCGNHPNFSDPGGNLSLNRLNAAGFAIPGTGTFGAITDTRAGISMRKLQFSLKLIF